MKLTVVFKMLPKRLWNVLIISTLFTNILCDLGQFRIPNYDNVLSEIVTKFIKNFYAKFSSTIYLCLASSDSEKNFVSLGLINHILYNTRASIVTQFEEYDHISVMKSTRFYNIFFVENYAAFRKIFEVLTPDKFDYQGYLLIIVTDYQEQQFKDMEKMLMDLWEIFIINVNIVLQDFLEQKGYIYTSFPYTNTYCSKVEPIIWNAFQNGQFQLEQEYFPNKIQNLFRCPLVVATFDIFPVMRLGNLEKLENSDKLEIDQITISGLDAEVLKRLAKSMNFKIKFVFDSMKVRWGENFPNGSTSGAMQKVY